MKRKLFKSLLAVAFICTGSNAWAATPTLTAAYEVAGYKFKAYYNLASSNIDGMCPTSGDLRYRDTYGLYNFGSGNRGGDITITVSSGDLIIFEAIQNQTYDNAINSVSDCTKNETISTGAYWAYDVTADATSLTINITRAEYIPAILVMEKDNTVKTVDYTIKYVDSNNQSIAEDLVLNGVVGNEVSANSSQTKPKYVDAQKYLYVSGNTPITLVENASSNVITLVYRAANAYTYKVKSSLGTEFANSSAFEEDVVYVTNPQYELIDNVLWEATKGSDWYQRSYTLTSNVDETITYTNTAIENVVLYMEGEDISGASVGSNTARASKGQMGYTGEAYKDVTTLPAGKYQIYLRGVNGNSASRPFSFKVGETEVFSGSIANGTDIRHNSDEFTVTAAGTLSVSCEGSSSSGLDWFYVKATGYPVSVSSVGWATAYTPYALDFSGVAGLTAYTATCDGSTVTLTEVTSVPANTGVVLEGEEGEERSYTIPFAATPASEQGDLEGNATEATAFDEFDGQTLYVLAPNGKGDVQFQPVTSGEIAAGKAYLRLTPSGVKALSVAFGTATGINAVESARQDGMMFNLAGQRVSLPARGLYIKNGKKVVVK